MKKVLITGATGAIGEACARYFSDNGYFVYIHYHSNQAKAEALSKELGNAEIEINSVSDNPLMNCEENIIYTGCNFYGGYMAHAADTL
ncbi:MAG: SDR family NAD(P)-dependent oxidoreductase, partial [Sulfurovaceae bacterium]